MWYITCINEGLKYLKISLFSSKLFKIGMELIANVYTFKSQHKHSYS